MYIISSCLVGVNCRYDGKNNIDSRLVEMVNSGKAIALCPEILGGLLIPREPCEIVKNSKGISVVGKSGEDYTEAFTLGAKKTLEICRIVGVNGAILKSRSPSCGSSEIYDGRFSGVTIKGSGLTASLLRSDGIEVYDESNFSELLHQ